MGKFATQKREKRRFYGNRHTKHPRIENEGEGESVTQQNNTESEVSSSVDEGNVVSIPSGISTTRNFYKSVLQETSVSCSTAFQRRRTPKASNDSSQDISGFRLCDMKIMANVFSIVSCPECNSASLSMEKNGVRQRLCF